MISIIIEATETTPKVRLDATSGVFEMSGCSRPNDVFKFYNPIIEWLKKYAQTPNEQTVFDFNLKYFDTASSKIIHDIMVKLKEIYNLGKSVTINWHYEADDCDLKEVGIELADIVEFPVNLIAY